MEDSMSEKLRATWKGDDPPTRFHAGIPARDLDEDDWQSLTKGERATARKSPLYDVKTDAEMRGEPRGDPDPDEDDDQALADVAPTEGGD
jgi:hypothetical protein